MTANSDSSPELEELIPKHRTFVREYLAGRRHSEAAIAAGYAKSCAAQTAYKLLQRDDIQKAIKAESKRARWGL